jgi:glycosyltransferase involved in cell wall biosynthesis
MKALFIGPNLAAGGAERQWSILLPGLRRRGADARLIALDAGGPFAAAMHEAGVPFEVLGMRNQADLPRLGRSRLIRGFAPDVVVTRGVSGLYVGGLIAAVRRGRHVYNDHRQVGMALSARREALTRAITRRIDLVIAVAEDQIDAWTARGLAASRIVVIPNGVPQPPALGSRSELRHELGLPESAVIALLVARLRPEKRVPDFVAAVRRARERHPELIGLIAGDGPDRAAIDAAVGADAAIRVLGHRDDVARLMGAADVFALASEYEAQPMAILEAMAAGLPVLATDVGGVGALVVSGETGLLVPPADPDAMGAALGRLTGAPDLRVQMGQAGRTRQRERWDAERMTDEYLHVLVQLVRRQERGADRRRRANSGRQ